jgi:hypothetical protein
MVQEIRHRKIYPDDLEWVELHSYVKGLQKLLKYYKAEKNWIEVPNLVREISGWWDWFGILGNLNDTDWAVDPIEGRIY